MYAKHLFEPKPHEKMEFALHRHPITFVSQIFLFALMVGLPYGLALLVAGDGTVTIEHPLARLSLILLGLAYYLGAWLFFLGQFTDYYLDISIVTDNRIIDIDQEGLFGRTVSELDLARVQDVRSEVKGIIPSLFNYGRVIVQTAGEEDHFIFQNVPKPHSVRQRILEIAAADRKHLASEMLAEKLSGTEQSLL